MARHPNHGVRKVCDCGRRRWSTCPHAWKLNYKWADVHYRISLDKEIGRRLKDKNEAKSEAEKIRIAIRAGTFRTPASIAPVPDAITFEALGTKWMEIREGRVARPQSEASCVAGWCAVPLAEGKLGAYSIGRVTEDDLERAWAALKARGLAGSTLNHYRQALRGMERWARNKGYLQRPWLAEDNDDTPIRHEAHARRDRRLTPDVLDKDGRVKAEGEETRLLKAANPWMQRLIIAALETGCRRGELLSLQWQDVNLVTNKLTIRAEKAKTRKARYPPISPRLKAVLELIKYDPNGKEHPPLAYVFGDAIGGQVADPKKAWAAACRRAGIEDLHFHDLRHEAGSRMVDRGWPVSHVQVMLGHANLSQTSTYLNLTENSLQDSMKRFGTAPLHVVAPEADQEHQPTCNDVAPSEKQVTVN